MIKIEKLEVRINNIENHITNTYFIYDDKNNLVIIDPGDEPSKIISKIKGLKLDLKYIFVTHAHADHIGAIDKLYDEFKCNIIVNAFDYDFLFDNIGNCSKYLNDMEIDLTSVDKSSIVKVNDNDKIMVGDMEFLFISTPGHTKGSMCIYEKNTNSLFTGDTMFSNYFGRCDLVSSSFDDMINSLKKLFNMFDDENLPIYSGHGENALFIEAKKKIKLFLAIKYNIKI